MDNPLRICHLGKYYPPANGGMESHVRVLAQGQADLGAEVTVLCVNHRDSAGADVTWRSLARTPAMSERDGPVRVLRVGRRATVARLDLCPGLFGALNEVRCSGVDLFHLHTPNPTVLLALVAWRRDVPLVVTHHSDVIRQKLLGLALRPFERLIYGRAAALLTTSPAYAAGSAQLRRYADRVQPLPLGIELAPYLTPSELALKHAGLLRTRHPGPIWLSIGRLVYYKGLENAVRALAEVPGTLLIVGTGPLEPKLKRLAADVGVGERVIWCGKLDDDALVGAYQAATALWFPSNARSEGFGLVQLEAMASGCPVINSRVPHSGVAWVCRHEREGLTTELNDPPAFAAAARRLLDEPGLRSRLAEAGRARAVQEFDSHTMARRSLDIYRMALGIGRPAAAAAVPE
ncbi:MAG: glycosyltransferase [Gemmataceae bacterium]